VLPLWQARPLQERVPFKRVRPAGLITCTNRFSALDGPLIDPPEPPDPPVPPDPGRSPLPPTHTSSPSTIKDPSTSSSSSSSSAPPPSSHQPTPSAQTGRRNSKGSRPAPAYPKPYVATHLSATFDSSQSSQDQGRVLLTLQGIVGSHPVRILVDSGAQGNFVSQGFVQSNSLPLTQDGCVGIRVTLADGRQQQTAGVLDSLPIRIDTYKELVPLTATELHGYQVILGYPWLYQHNPVVCWRGRSITFRTADGRKHVLRRLPTSPAPFRTASVCGGSQPHALEHNTRLNLISTNQLRKEQVRGNLAFVCLVYPSLLAEASVSSAGVGLSAAAAAPLHACSKHEKQQAGTTKHIPVVTSSVPVCAMTLESKAQLSEHGAGALGQASQPAPKNRCARCSTIHDLREHQPPKRLDNPRRVPQPVPCSCLGALLPLFDPAPAALASLRHSSCRHELRFPTDSSNNLPNPWTTVAVSHPRCLLRWWTLDARLRGFELTPATLVRRRRSTILLSVWSPQIPP
jgi:hypothetical protein